MADVHERIETRELLIEARRNGRVAISTLSLKAAVALFCLGIVLYCGELCLRLTIRFLETGTINEITLARMNVAPLLVVALSALAIPLLVGLLQSRFFFSLEPVIPRLPHPRDTFQIQSLVKRTGEYLVAVFCSALLVVVAIRYGASPLLSALQYPEGAGVLMVSTYLLAITKVACIILGLSVIVFAILRRFSFILQLRWSQKR